MDYCAWPIKELRRFLTERGKDPSSIVEKADLVAQVGAQPLPIVWQHHVGCLEGCGCRIIRCCCSCRLLRSACLMPAGQVVYLPCCK